MTHFTKFLYTLAGCAALVLGDAIAASPPAKWETVSFQAVIRGTSTVHDWSVESTRAEAALELADGAVKGSLRIPAKSLAGGPAGLNEKMYAALKVMEHPTILFEASEVAWPAGTIQQGMTLPWPVRGRLTIAGTGRDISPVGRITLQAAGALAIEVAVDLKLTDFAIKPPTFMAFVRTGDALNVQVRWVVRPAPVSVAGR